MGQFGPYETRVEIVERSTRFIDLMIRNNDPNVTQYKILGGRVLNDVYGDPTSATGGTSKVLGTGAVEFINAVGREQGFRSQLLIKRGLGRLESRAQLRRMSRVMFDPDDYASLPDMPAEEELLFVRVQEFAVTTAGFRTVLGPVNNGGPVLGPIVVVPPVRFYGSPNAVLNLGGLAPANTQASAGAVVPLSAGDQEPRAMHIVLPRPSGVTIVNRASGTGLLYATGLGRPMVEVPQASSVYIEGGVKELLLASADNAGGGAVAPVFSLTAVVNLGVQL